MLRQKYRLELDAGLRDAFALLLIVIAEQRWAQEEAPGGAPPVGTRYAWRRGNRLRSGQVLECLRPVVLTLSEALLDPPCHLQLRLRFRCEPCTAGTMLQLEASCALNGAAMLRRRYWADELARYWDGLFRGLGRAIACQGEDEIACNGQNTGSSSITTVNATSVSGTPRRR